MTKYKWSVINNSFFPTVKIDNYIAAGWNLSDAVDIDDDIAEMYMKSPPEGKVRGVDDNGMPTWVDEPEKSNSELYSIALDSLNAQYKIDTNTLSASYATAALADGPNQTTKQTAIYQQYQSLKAQYISDAAALKVKYGV
ncbi:Uncharacterised protein [Yersinia intermedia]|uniref:tail fiber assembly protein n=1 Tax=Yersinia intermedia TaxID=631 RepID=UPI0005E47A9F|nr:tail fiber assembly protein [Yersinia intermedia]CNH59559.1 Uncharacterised protein [Yersinia intermedia]